MPEFNQSDEGSDQFDLNGLNQFGESKKVVGWQLNVLRTKLKKLIATIKREGTRTPIAKNISSLGIGKGTSNGNSALIDRLKKLFRSKTISGLDEKEIKEFKLLLVKLKAAEVYIRKRIRQLQVVEMLDEKQKEEQAAIQKIREEVQAFKEKMALLFDKLDRKIKERIGILKAKIPELRKKLADVRKEIKETKEEIEYLKGQIEVVNRRIQEKIPQLEKPLKTLLEKFNEKHGTSFSSTSVDNFIQKRKDNPEPPKNKKELVDEFIQELDPEELLELTREQMEELEENIAIIEEEILGADIKEKEELEKKLVKQEEKLEELEELEEKLAEELDEGEELEDEMSSKVEDLEEEVVLEAIESVGVSRKNKAKENLEEDDSHMPKNGM